MKITDFKLTFKDMDTAVRATRMFELRKQIGISAMDGKFRDARKYKKELAKEAVNDFETYKKLPFLHFDIAHVPVKAILDMALNSYKFKIFNKFIKKTPEEKQFDKLSKEYFSSLSPEEIKKNTIDITIPALF